MKIKLNQQPLVITLLCIGALFFVFGNYHIKTPPAEKQKGAHVFGINDTSFYPYLSQSNIEWITLVSWGYQNSFDSPKLTHHNGDSVLMKQSDTAWINRINMARSRGFKVFLKPHIWVRDHAEGKWRQDIFPTNEENWTVWKKNYRDFIVRYARVAEKAGVEMFCIGTELTKIAIEKPNFWKNLIAEVRKIYTGKITYAANWYKEFEAINFWNELDYIGVQAYFPLADTTYPTVAQITQGWNKYLPILEQVSKKHNKQIIFTEMGYKSTADCAIKPWLWLEKTPANERMYSAESQENCYTAFFNAIWKKNWFAGVHIWQLRSDYNKRKNRANVNLDFYPQDKPAEKIIANGFGEF